ncbi:MAG: hypothetical protein MUC97_17505 [Bernardetiaceae bacterium]|jgi:hypothetical protein|nr:hypothetical protein [Bernardetiaceae bacterium]
MKPTKIPFLSWGIWFALALHLVACQDGDETAPENKYTNGTLVVGTNEISFIGRDGQVTDGIFQKENGRPLEGSVWRARRFDDRIFLLSINLAKIEIIDARNLKSLASIPLNPPGTTEFNKVTPHDVAVLGNRAYVTCNSASVSVWRVVDMTTNQIIGQIPSPISSVGS